MGGLQKKLVQGARTRSNMVRVISSKFVTHSKLDSQHYWEDDMIELWLHGHQIWKL